MKENDFCHRVTLFFAASILLIIFWIGPVLANHFTTTPAHNMENQIIDSLRRRTASSYSPHQSSTIKESVKNNLRNEYLQSTSRNTFIGYGLFVKSDYLKNYSTTSRVNNFKSSYQAQQSRNNATHKTGADFQKNNESQIEKYQTVNTENKKYNNDQYADRIKYLIMGDENLMKVSKVNSTQNLIATSRPIAHNFRNEKEELNQNRLQNPSNSSNKLTNTMIVDQHTRIMLQMNHGVNNDTLLESFEKKGKFESLSNNSSKKAMNNSIGITRAGQKNLILDINNYFGKNESYGHNMNHGDYPRFQYQDHVRRPQGGSQEIHKVHTFSKFEPYPNSHMDSNPMGECKSCQHNYSPMTNHMRDKDVIVGNGQGPFFNKHANSGQGSLVPMNSHIIRNPPPGHYPSGFKVNTPLDQKVVVNNPIRYDPLSSNSMNVNKFEMGVGMNHNPMNTSNKIKMGAEMRPHPMQPNKHSFMMQNSYNKQPLATVSQGSMIQNTSSHEHGYSYIPPDSYHVNGHDQSSLHGNEEHKMKPYYYKIPNNDMMLKPQVDSHSQNNNEKEYMEHVIKNNKYKVQSSMMSKPHENDHEKEPNVDSHGQNNDEEEYIEHVMKNSKYELQSSMMSKPHTHPGNENHHEKEHMMKPHYSYDVPSKPFVEGQNSMEKGSFMEQMMMLMMMKLGDHMAPNNVINFHVGSDKHDDKIKMEPMMKFNRIHPMLPMLPMHKTTSAAPDKKEDDKYVMVKMPGQKKEEEKYVMVKMPSKPETAVDHSYIPYDTTGWMSGWYSGIVFPDKKKILTVIFLIVVVLLAKKLLLALAVIKFFLAIVPVLAFILLLKQYLFYFLITKGLKFFKWFKKIPLLFAASPLFFFPIIIPFFYLCQGQTTDYTVTYPTFTYPTFTFPTFTFPTFTFPTFPTNPETTGRTETMTMPPPTTQTLTTTTTTMTTPTTTTTMVTTMTDTMSMNTESMASQTMSMATQPMTMGTQPMATQPMSMSSSSMSMASPPMSMASPPMSMATQPMTMGGRIGVLKPTKRPVSKTTTAMNIVRNRVRVKHTKLPALTQYKNDINSYRITIASNLKKTTPMFPVSTGKKRSTATHHSMKHPLRWYGITKKPQPTKSMDKLVTNKQKISSITNSQVKKNNNQASFGVKVKDQKYVLKNSSNYSKSPQKIGSLQNKIKPVVMKNAILNRDKQKLKAVLQAGAIVKTVKLKKGSSKTEKSIQIVNEDLPNGVELLREKFPRQSSSFLSLFNRMWSALVSDKCMERIGCHLAVNSKRVSNYNALMIRVLQSLFSMRANRRIRSYIKAYQLGSKKDGSHFMCRYLFPCLGILKI